MKKPKKEERSGYDITFVNTHPECLLANPDHKPWHVPLTRPVPPRPGSVHDN